MKHCKRLSNGMRVHLVPFSGTDAVTVLVQTKVGSRNEDDKVWGGSHFIEHLMFKGTKKRPTALDISKTLDRYGAEYNAYTGKEVTGYYVKIAGDKAPVAIDLLYDMIFQSTYKPTEMNRERKVIIEEIKMYEENPIMHIGDLLEEAMFDGNPLGREIAGTPETMMGMKRKDLIAYRDAFYIPSRMVIALAGNVPDDAMERLEKTFGKVREAKEPPSYLPFGDMPERKTPRVGRQYKDVGQIQMALGFPTPGKTDKDQYALKLLAAILGGGMSSRLFVQVRERRGLCYSVRASSRAYQDVGMFTVSAGLDAARLTEALKVIIGELKKVARSGVTAQELRYIKDQVEGATTLSLEDSSARAEFYGRQELFYDQVLTPEEQMKRVRAVRAVDIARVAKETFDMGRLSIAAIGPYKTDQALLKHLPF